MKNFGFSLEKAKNGVCSFEHLQFKKNKKRLIYKINDKIINNKKKGGSQKEFKDLRELTIKLRVQQASLEKKNATIRKNTSSLFNRINRGRLDFYERFEKVASFVFSILKEKQPKLTKILRKFFIYKRPLTEKEKITLIASEEFGRLVPLIAMKFFKEEKNFKKAAVEFLDYAIENMKEGENFKKEVIDIKRNFRVRKKSRGLNNETGRRG